MNARVTCLAVVLCASGLAGCGGDEQGTQEAMASLQRKVAEQATLIETLQKAQRALSEERERDRVTTASLSEKVTALAERVTTLDATVQLMRRADSVSPLKAQSFGLVDKDGKERAMLAMDSEGQPFLALRDEKGENRAELGLDKDGQPRLALWDDKGRNAASLVLGEDGRPALALFDEKGENRAQLRLDKDGQPSLFLSDENGKAAVVLAVAQGGPVLGLVDEDGKSRAELTLDKDGKPSLHLRDKEGKGGAVLGSTSLVSTKTGEMTIKPESSLVLFDKLGNVILALPQ